MSEIDEGRRRRPVKRLRSAEVARILGCSRQNVADLARKCRAYQAQTGRKRPDSSRWLVHEVVEAGDRSQLRFRERDVIAYRYGPVWSARHPVSEPDAA